MDGKNAAARIQALVMAMNRFFRARTGGRLQVRAIHDAWRGRYAIRTDLVDPDGAGRKRRESPELSPDQAVRLLEALVDAVRRM